MSYELECKDNAGFEDILTTGKKYKVMAFNTNSVLINDDKDNVKWLGEVHFCQPEYQD